MQCPACGTSNPHAQRFCGRCGAALVSSDSETIASPVTPRAATDTGRYVPGQILAGRYRMVGLLGRGAMGEVYRADDLKLGQPVALKFLPCDVGPWPEPDWQPLFSAAGLTMAEWQPADPERAPSRGLFPAALGKYPAGHVRPAEEASVATHE